MCTCAYTQPDKIRTEEKVGAKPDPERDEVPVTKVKAGKRRRKVRAKSDKKQKKQRGRRCGMMNGIRFKVR